MKGQQMEKRSEEGKKNKLGVPKGKNMEDDEKPHAMGLKRKIVTITGHILGSR